MAFDNLIVEDRGATRIITLNRPDVLNALNRRVLGELAHAVADIAADPDIRCAILTGAGEKSFVAGADIGEMKNQTPAEAEEQSAYGHAVMDSVENLRVPVIAAVNGFALGGGLELALACDFIYASENAKLGLVEVNLGLIPGFGGVARLSRRVGPARARELVYTASVVKASEALEIGLVNKVVPRGEAVEAACQTATVISEKGPYAVRLVKGMLNVGQDADLRTANVLEQRSFGLAFGSQDAGEGIAAFLEKRNATFQGK